MLFVLCFHAHVSFFLYSELQKQKYTSSEANPSIDSCLDILFILSGENYDFICLCI